MFYEGSLQEGLSTAVGQQKLVFCFVTNDNDESNTWEKEFLQDPSLKDVIAKQAVALRLTAGSEEAGYLAQIFPLPQTPTIVIMKHGELKEYIAAGTTKEEFLRRVQNSFNIAPPPAAQPSSSEALSSSPPTSTGVPSTVERSDNVRRVLEERAAKLKAEREAAEKTAKEERARKKAKADAESGGNVQKQKQAEILKKKKTQESEERRRILKRIEDDKEERRKRATMREQQRMGLQSRRDSSSSTATATPSVMSSTAKMSNTTSIQVRLFDGSTIRSRFQTSDAMSRVRKWVDENRTDGESPYAFKQLLTPLPNKSIDETEEDKSLGETGLAPSSTLVLVPVQKFASAYSGSPQGFFSRIIALVLGFFTWILGFIGLGRGSNNSQEAASDSSESASSQAKNRRIQGFENPTDRRRDHQLYNGNSLNFEPRPDEDEK